MLLGGGGGCGRVALYRLMCGETSKSYVHDVHICIEKIGGRGCGPLAPKPRGDGIGHLHLCTPMRCHHTYTQSKNPKIRTKPYCQQLQPAVRPRPPPVFSVCASGVLSGGHGGSGGHWSRCHRAGSRWMHPARHPRRPAGPLSSWQRRPALGSSASEGITNELDV